ncbi:hypothetical protein KM043_013753 [Ampulex compressa]|nr:hypothetical protein KM043_013753 [Ampulex compressa]
MRLKPQSSTTNVEVKALISSHLDIQREKKISPQSLLKLQFGKKRTPVPYLFARANRGGPKDGPASMSLDKSHKRRDRPVDLMGRAMGALGG